jgi:hypothetical protein
MPLSKPRRDTHPEPEPTNQNEANKTESAAAKPGLSPPSPKPIFFQDVVHTKHAKAPNGNGSGRRITSWLKSLLGLPQRLWRHDTKRHATVLHLARKPSRKRDW